MLAKSSGKMCGMASEAELEEDESWTRGTNSRNHTVPTLFDGVLAQYFLLLSCDPRRPNVARDREPPLTHGRRFTIFDGGKVDKKRLLAVRFSLARDKREKSQPKGILLRHFWMAFLSFGHVSRKVFHE